jgi:uncharacterized protein (DUF2147 family)
MNKLSAHCGQEKEVIMQRIAEKKAKLAMRFTVVAMVFMFTSCSPKPENPIVGKWKNIDGTETMEFFKDGTVSLVGKEMSLGGTYKFVDTNRMKLEYGDLGAWMGPIITTISISGNELTLTMPDGKV